MSTPFTVLFVRHGATEATEKGYLAGRAPIPLTDRGRQQLEALVPAIVSLKPDAIYSSPLPRTRESAAILAAATGLPVHELDELVEVDPGEWQGQAIRDLEANSESWRAFHRDPTLSPPPRGETLYMIRDRMVAAVEVIRRAGHKRPIVISHGDVIRVALCHYLDIPLRRMHTVIIFPGTLSALYWGKDRAYLWLLNHPGPPATGGEEPPPPEPKAESASAEGASQTDDVLDG